MRSIEKSLTLLTLRIINQPMAAIAYTSRYSEGNRLQENRVQTLEFVSSPLHISMPVSEDFSLDVLK